jgi:hypothetical protein
MIMRRIRLLLILITLLVVLLGYEIYQQSGVKNEHLTLAAELPVASPPCSMGAIKSPKKLVDISAQYGIAKV